MTQEEIKILDSINEAIADFFTDLVGRADNLQQDRNGFLERATSIAQYAARVGNFTNFIGN